MTEAQLSQRVVDIAKENGWMVYRRPIDRNAQRHSVKDAVGYPDLTLARDGRALWIELKVGYNDLSTSQQYWAATLPLCYVVTDRFTDEQLAAILR